MRVFQRLTIVAFILIAATFAAIQVYTRFLTDTTPPVISFDSDTIEVSVSDPDDVLLNGVSAVDDTDGDLTDQIMILGSTQFLSENTVKVTYLVFDSANNISTASRLVRYTDYEEPKFSITEPLVYSRYDKIQIMDRLLAFDVKDGNISSSIRVSTQDLDPYEIGVQTVTAQVINPLGDQVLLPLKLVILNEQEIVPLFALSEYIVYLDQRSHYNARQYITDAVSPDNIRIDSNVDTRTPGVYHTGYELSVPRNPDRPDPDQMYTYAVYQTVVVR